jgi:hypothetical protein
MRYQKIGNTKQKKQAKKPNQTQTKIKHKQIISKRQS